MSKSFNPKQQFMCSLCGWYYTEEQGHNLNDCAGRIKQLQIELSREMRDLEQKYEEANKRAQEQAQRSKEND